MPNSCNATILIAPQAFKGTLSAFEAAKAIEIAVRRSWPEASLIIAPVADGGDGTLDILMQAKQGEYRTARVKGPLNEEIEAAWGVWPEEKIAIIETARICGLKLTTEEKRNPAITTSYGVGQVILAALDEGVRDFIIGLGGSSTHDGGAGAAQALGVQFINREGKELPPGGLALTHLEKIAISGLDPRVKKARFTICCDVINPLLGPEGATLYAPQKGASPALVEALEQSMQHYALKVQESLGIDISILPGGGAAGGLGAGLHAFLGAHLKSGIETILSLLNFEEKLKKADLVLIGEGRLDSQTSYNKAPAGVAKAAKRLGIPVLAIVGEVEEGYQCIAEIDAVVPLSSIAEVIQCVRIGKMMH